MPVQLNYPGVYIEEVPSGVRTITGVATSIAAFVGRALKGPVNEPTVINSFGDYIRLFGGLDIISTMSYAVRDFYLNGGSQAVIVRLVNNASTAAISLPTSVAGDNLVLQALNEGEWGNHLGVNLNYKTDDPTQTPLSPSSPINSINDFNLIIYVDGTKTEEYLGVSLTQTDIRYLPRLLEQSSALMKVRQVPANVPNPTIDPVTTKPAIAGASGGRNGDDLTATQYLVDENQKTGIYALKKADLFNLLCIPPPLRNGDTEKEVYQAARKLCVDKRAMLLVDSPLSWGASSAMAANTAKDGLTELNLAGIESRNAALYFPRVKQADPLRKGQVDTFVPCGIIAGIMARTDTTRGVWKSPAGIDASLSGITGLQVNLSDEENGLLNPIGINCLRSFPITGRVVWGARTLRGADLFADDYKYVSVRRTALFLEESLYRGTQWVVFEPNDEPLWAQIRLNVGAFMHNLFRQGAFQGTTPKQAYLVKCDRETTTQNDINLGIVNIVVGFAPLKPAEFVIIKIQQLTGEIES